MSADGKGIKIYFDTPRTGKFHIKLFKTGEGDLNEELPFYGNKSKQINILDNNRIGVDLAFSEDVSSYVLTGELHEIAD